MIVLCPNCRFHRAPLPGHLVGAGSTTGLSPGQLEAGRELLQLESERRDMEERRLDENYRFDYEPQFHAWCRRFTPSARHLAKAMRRLMRGDERFLLMLHKLGLDVIIDAVNGAARPVFALCAQKNIEGKCRAFKPRSS